LGETYEFISPDKRWRFFAEQVSHHPPIGVAETSSDNYTLHLEMELKTKFKGNSAEASVIGNCYMLIPKFNDDITWNHLETCANNVIIGGMWVDHYGDLEIKNNTTGDICSVKFTRCGYFGSGRYEINGFVQDKTGAKKLHLFGKWNEVVYAAKVAADGTEGQPIVLWKRTPPPNNKWSWTKFNEEMNTVDPNYEAVLPPTDSRLRGDRRELERGNNELAGKEKVRLEERQRSDRKDRETAKEEYIAKYYSRIEEDDGNVKWVYNGKYWEEQQERLKNQSNPTASSTPTPSSE